MSRRSYYARLERERRFLLAAAPTGPVVAAPEPRVLFIEDRYLRGTRLRLRSVQEAGLAPVRKLGQKVRPDQNDPSIVEHTTIYLDTTRPPVAWVADVTDDERFTGGHLARTSATQLTALLRRFGVETAGG